MVGFFGFMSGCVLHRSHGSQFERLRALGEVFRVTRDTRVRPRKVPIWNMRNFGVPLTGLAENKRHEAGKPLGFSV